MPLSEAALDILESLPKDTVLYDDGKEFIKVKVPVDSIITGKMLRPWHNITVNFRTRVLTICISTETSPQMQSKGSPRKSQLKPETESERLAAKMADSMGCVDCDCLVPDFALVTNSNDTILKIRRLLRVDDDLIRLEIPSAAKGYAYCMKNKETLVFFACDKKRKISD